MLTYELLRHAGTIMQHVVGVLILSWRRMLRAMGVAAFVGLVLAEVLGCITTRSFPPPLLTHVVALALAAALAYAVALTLLLDELLKGAIATVRVAEGDVRAGARALGVLAEREAGEAGHGITRWLGHHPEPAGARPTPRAPTRGSAATRVQDRERDESGDGVTAETLADIAATEEFANTAPRPRVNARPVRADQFPRIEWAADPADDSGVHVVVPPSRAVPAPMPPIPMRDEIHQPSERPELGMPRTVPVTTRPLAGDGDAWTPPSALTVVQRADTQAQAMGRSQSMSRPEPRKEAARGLWSRISQALVGDTRPLKADDGTHAEAPGGGSDTPAAP